MKKYIHTIVLAGLASVLIARAQTNTTVAGQPVDNTNTAATSLSDTNVVPATNTVPAAVPPATTNAVPDTAAAATNTTTATANAVIADTNTVVAATNTAVATTNTAFATTNIAPVAVDTNAAATAAATATTNSDASAVSSTNGPDGAIPNIPLIQFSDVPITTAIEHLARQAGINYMMDPKIGYGVADANGQVKPEPQLSIRWENITAENALRALLDNYGLQLVVDKKTAIDRVTIKDPTAPPPLITRVVQLQYANVSNMVTAVQSVMGDKRSRVIPDSRTSQLLIVATDPEQASVDTLVAQLDKPSRQVLIETKLVEISSQPTTKRGVDWTSTLANQNVSFGNGQIVANPSDSHTIVTTPGPTSPGSSTPGGGFGTGGSTAAFGQNTMVTLLQGVGNWSASTRGGLIPSTAFLNADGLNAVLSFINASYDAQVYSTPRVVTLDNQSAHIEVVRTFPIISVSGASANSSSSATITYSNVGTILDVTPRISANDNIWLQVIPEVSSHFADETVTFGAGAGGTSGSFSVPIFDRRRIQSQVMIPNGNTLVMGGLVQDSPNASYTKVPFLGDIPGLGWAFHSESKAMAKDNLIIFLTPTIVKDEDFQPTTSTFLQSQLKTMRSPMNPHKKWDGAEPEADWSNPAPIPGEFDAPRPVQ